MTCSFEDGKFSDTVNSTGTGKTNERIVLQNELKQIEDKRNKGRAFKAPARAFSLFS